MHLSDRLRSLWRGETVEDDVKEELEHHLAMRTQESIAAGMTPAEARADALRRFGDVETYRQRTSAIDERIERGRRRTQRLDLAWRSIQQAARSLSRQPSFALVALFTLALGMGATTAIYTLLDAVVLRPLPYPAADRLVTITHPVPGVGPEARFGLSVANYFYYRQHARSLEDLGAYMTSTVSVAGDGEAQRVRVVYTTASLLNVLGARPSAGRLITEEDDQPPGRFDVAVLSNDFWMRRYGGDESVIGRALSIGGRAVEVVGVLAPGLQLPFAHAELWIPQGMDPSEPAYDNHVWSAVGRLGEGVSVQAAQSELTRLVAQFETVFPEVYTPAMMNEVRFSVAVTPLRDEVVGGIARVLWILLGSVALVLLIACANVANLFLVRTEARRREVGIRSALGAGRRDLAWHYLSESLLLAVLAGICGVFLAHSAIRVLVALSPAGIPRLSEVTLSIRSVLVAVALSVVAGIVFGSFPLARAGVALGSLREGGRGATASRRRHALRGMLVAGQVALALVLLTAAALMLQSFRNLRSVDAGIEPAGVLVFDLTLPSGRYDTHAKVHEFYRELTARLEGLSNVVAAGVGSSIPLNGSGGCAAVFVEGRSLAPGSMPPCVHATKATPGLAEAIGMRVHGRTPAWTDGGVGTGTAIVTRALADRLWPGEDALGKGIRANGDEPPYYEVVGIAEGVRGELDGPPLEAVYYPMAPMAGASLWSPSRSVTVALRTTSDRPESYIPAVKRMVAEMDATVPIANARSMERMVAEGLARTSFTMLLLGIAAGMALVLSVVGLYGVISYVVGQRTSEMGVRLALGARVDQVRNLVMRQALRVVAAGIVVGMAAAFTVTRTLGALLFQVSPNDPVVLACVTIILVAVAALACWVPARRAGKTNPIEALRME